jgi:hypothetical protein
VRRTESDVTGPGLAGHSRLIAGPPLSLLGTQIVRPEGPIAGLACCRGAPRRSGRQT